MNLHVMDVPYQGECQRLISIPPCWRALWGAGSCILHYFRVRNNWNLAVLRTFASDFLKLEFVK